MGLLLVTLWDVWRLYRPDITLTCVRRLPRLFNLGDANVVRLELQNTSPLKLQLTLIEELPVQLQIRDFTRDAVLAPGEEQTIRYEVRPTERGEYTFGATNIFIRQVLGLVERRVIANPSEMTVGVYPSILQMKQMELQAFNRTSTLSGIKKIRRIGHSYEFEQIKNYVRGDDYRSINWKATSRRGNLMVNQYEDERAQQVYCLLDKSRSMRLPFAGLSLMDYSINSILALSNIVLGKYDRAGLISFSDKLGAIIKADSRPQQLQKILTALYKEKERPLEANYELLYFAARKLITGRSLLLLFTNFESAYALERVLPVLRRINRIHLLVVVFFENSEIRQFAETPPTNLEGVYEQTTARKFLAEKEQLVQKLSQYGIQAILTKPEELSINTINKYLELKSRGLI
ncbi:MAG: DUF58 domain-containing protein [Lewinellaceae bacterium]|nr:DUF58 domain-containing protein [Lewinellaceae bacterium]